jgi:hypothetical protein
LQKLNALSAPYLAECRAIAVTFASDISETVTGTTTRRITGTATRATGRRISRTTARTTRRRITATGALTRSPSRASLNGIEINSSFGVDHLCRLGERSILTLEVICQVCFRVDCHECQGETKQRVEFFHFFCSFRAELKGV